MVNLEDFKNYARLDETATDAQMFLDAALQHARDAGIPSFLFDIDDPKLTLYVYAIADHLYENRGFGRADPTGSDEYVEHEKRKMRVELKYRYPEYRSLTLTGFEDEKGAAQAVICGAPVLPGTDTLLLYSTASITITAEAGYAPGTCTNGSDRITLSKDGDTYTASVRVIGNIMLTLEEVDA